MPPDADVKKKVARKLTKRRKEGHQVTMEIPDRFKDGDDADMDFTTPAAGGNAFMNQSVFGMIAAAGSQVDFNSRFDPQSSDDEDEESSPQNSGLQVNKTRRQEKAPAEPGKPEKHRRKFSENRLLRSLPRLGTRSKSKSSKTSPRTSSPGSPVPESPSEQIPPAIQLSRTASRDAPVMSRMLEAKAELSMRPSSDLPRPDSIEEEDTGGKKSSALARRLMEIFDFDKPEDVIEGMSKLPMTWGSANLRRISLLAFEKCIATRIYVYNLKTYLFLCISTKEIGMPMQPQSHVKRR